MVITLLTEDNDEDPTGHRDVYNWADRYDLTHPVLADPEWLVSFRYITGDWVELPAMHVLRPGMEVERVDSYITYGEVLSMLPEESN